MMYEGEDVNTIDLLYEAPTMEGNGVKVVITVKSDDRKAFFTKIKEQLAYFENVYFDVDIRFPEIYHWQTPTQNIINNDFKINRDEKYQWSELITTEDLHICLDNVYYPIDFEKLNINRIKVPVGIRFNLTDGVYPTINREAIRYSPEAKVIILNKIKDVADDFMLLYNESISNTDELSKIFDYHSNDQRHVQLNNDNYDVKSLLGHSRIDLKIPTLKNVTLLDLKRINEKANVLLEEYTVKFRINKDQFTQRVENAKLQTKKNMNKSVYTYTEIIPKLKREYLKSIVSDNTVFVRKTPYKLDGKWSDETYRKILTLGKHPKSEWRTRIKEFQYVQSLITDKWKHVDDIIIPQSWKDDRKKDRLRASANRKSRRLKLEGEVSCKIAESLERKVNGKHCKFVSTAIKGTDIHKYKGLTIYDNYSEASALDSLYEIIQTRKNNLRLMTFSTREMKNIENFKIHNLISYTKFMEGENKAFKRIITAYLINDLIDKYSSAFAKVSLLETISKDLYTKMKTLKSYKTNHYYTSSTTIYAAMLEVANANQLFDMSIYDEYLHVKRILKKLPFINNLPKISTRNYYGGNDLNDDIIIEIMRDMFKYNKHRIDYQNYDIKLNDDSKQEESVSEKDVEKLENITV